MHGAAEVGLHSWLKGLFRPSYFLRVRPIWETVKVVGGKRRASLVISGLGCEEIGRLSVSQSMIAVGHDCVFGWKTNTLPIPDAISHLAGGGNGRK